MREIADHLTGGSGDSLSISATDEPGAGGANHRYSIKGFDTKTNASCPNMHEFGMPTHDVVLLFQNGAIPENGINGITQEALLAVVIDRLRRFQAGPFANDYNEQALQHAEEALDALKRRTLDRVERGVEGQHKA